MVKAIVQQCTRLTVHNIPHLRLPKGFPKCTRIGIVRVNLNGKTLLCVNQLDKHREIRESCTVRAKHGMPRLCKVFRQC